MKKRSLLTALLLSALMVPTGACMAATPVHVDAATEGLADKVPSKVLDVKIETPEIRQISNVVYEQVASRGYPNVAMKMDILQPQQKEPLPAIARRARRKHSGAMARRSLAASMAASPRTPRLQKPRTRSTTSARRAPRCF